MMYSEVHGNRLSLLGFGAMRLPTCGDGSIDQQQVKAMVDYAMENGVNYYLTIYEDGIEDSGMYWMLLTLEERLVWLY